ncbi:UNKNOWN [Stylonychia lemnae]|uniref:Uncharacterized protein n=1 Tax=Stylonychia lemnae TaxID=5949 RepID=A0A077ZZ39_STYLE|nr:UNKNOWN [Stylonychia lemnae]|eukprot:CDW74473.1 UNKNOWN [Stylonychia lemnae]
MFNTIQEQEKSTTRLHKKINTPLVNDTKKQKQQIQTTILSSKSSSNKSQLFRDKSNNKVSKRQKSKKKTVYDYEEDDSIDSVVLLNKSQFDKSKIDKSYMTLDITQNQSQIYFVGQNKSTEKIRDQRVQINKNISKSNSNNRFIDTQRKQIDFYKSKLTNFILDKVIQQSTSKIQNVIFSMQMRQAFSKVRGYAKEQKHKQQREEKRFKTIKLKMNEESYNNYLMQSQIFSPQNDTLSQSILKNVNRTQTFQQRPRKQVQFPQDKQTLRKIFYGWKNLYRTQKKQRKQREMRLKVAVGQLIDDRQFNLMNKVFWTLKIFKDQNFIMRNLKDSSIRFRNYNLLKKAITNLKKYVIYVIKEYRVTLNLKPLRAVFKRFKKLWSLKKSALKVLKLRRKRNLPHVFEAWYKLVASGDHVNYECARIHYQGKLMNKVFSILTFQMRKLAYWNQRKQYMIAIKILRAWRNRTQQNRGQQEFVNLRIMRLKYKYFQIMKTVLQKEMVDIDINMQSRYFRMIKLQHKGFFALKSNLYIKLFQNERSYRLIMKSFKILKKYYIKSVRIDHKLNQMADEQQKRFNLMIFIRRLNEMQDIRDQRASLKFGSVVNFQQQQQQFLQQQQKQQQQSYYQTTNDENQLHPNTQRSQYQNQSQISQKSFDYNSNHQQQSHRQSKQNITRDHSDQSRLSQGKQNFSYLQSSHSSKKNIFLTQTQNFSNQIKYYPQIQIEEENRPLQVQSMFTPSNNQNQNYIECQELTMTNPTIMMQQDSVDHYDEDAIHHNSQTKYYEREEPQIISHHSIDQQSVGEEECDDIDQTLQQEELEENEELDYNSQQFNQIENNTMSTYNPASFRNLNANSQFIIKNMRYIFTLKLKKKIFDNILIFYYYSKDKKKLDHRLFAFNNRQVVKRAFKALAMNYADAQEEELRFESQRVLRETNPIMDSRRQTNHIKEEDQQEQRMSKLNLLSKKIFKEDLDLSSIMVDKSKTQSILRISHLR